MEADRRPRGHVGLILGGAGLTLLFGPAAVLLLVPSIPAIALVIVMVVGLAVLVAAFVIVPRRR